MLIIASLSVKVISFVEWLEGLVPFTSPIRASYLLNISREQRAQLLGVNLCIPNCIFLICVFLGMINVSSGSFSYEPVGGARYFPEVSNVSRVISIPSLK